MKEFSNSFKFRDLAFRAQKYQWCADWNCTTCGAKDLRPRLEKFTRAQIIEGLRSLSQDFVDNPNSLEFIIFCFYSASIFKNGYDLIEELKDTPVSEVLDRAITKSYRKRDDE
jgi:hypothetical protein